MFYNGTDYAAREDKKFTAGEYKCRIEDMAEKISKKSGKNMLEFTLTVIEGPMKDYRLWYYAVDGEYFIRNVGNILSAIGADPSAQLELTPSLFKGKVLVAVVKVVDEKENISYFKKPTSASSKEECPF